MDTIPEIPADLMKPGEAAKLLQVHVSTVYRCMEDGELPYWRGPARNRRVSRRDVVALVQREHVEPAATRKEKGKAERKKSAHERQQQSSKTLETLKRHGLDKYL